MLVRAGARAEAVGEWVEHAFAARRFEILGYGHAPNLASVFAMESVQSRYRRLFVDGSNPERLVFFSDAVFAIAMTLLVIDLRVPEDAPGSAADVLLDAWPGFFAYGLSFAIIAINWRSHYRRFRVIESHDGALMTLNLLLLFVVAFVPFPTSLLSTYGPQPAAVALYATTVGLLSLLGYAQWRYAWRHSFVRKDVDESLYRYVRANQLTTPIVFGLSIPIALLWSGEIAMYFWIVLFPVAIIQQRLLNRSRG